MTMGRPVVGLCRPAFLRPTPADPNERSPARAMLRQTPPPPIRSRCVRAQWPVGWRRLAMESAIQVARLQARPRDESARLFRLARWAPRTRAAASTSGAASARSDQRIGETRLSTRAINSASASVFVARRSSSSSHSALPIPSRRSRSCRLTRSVLCGVGCATMTDCSCSIAAKLGVGVPVPPRVFNEESAPALARRKRLAESLIVVLVGAVRLRDGLPAWAILAQPFINCGLKTGV